MNYEEETMLSIIENQKDCEFSLRFILQRDGQQWKNCFTILKLVKKGTRKQTEQDYGEYLICEKLLTIQEGQKILHMLCQEGEDERKLLL